MAYINKKGRISRSDLMIECNRLIKLNPSEEVKVIITYLTYQDKAKLKKEQSNLLKQIESDLKSIDEAPSS